MLLFAIDERIVPLNSPFVDCSIASSNSLAKGATLWLLVRYETTPPADFIGFFGWYITQRVARLSRSSSVSLLTSALRVTSAPLSSEFLNRKLPWLYQPWMKFFSLSESGQSPATPKSGRFSTP